MNYREKRISERRGAAQCMYCEYFDLKEKLFDNSWGNAKGECTHSTKHNKIVEGLAIQMRRKCKPFIRKRESKEDVK